MEITINPKYFLIRTFPDCHVLENQFKITSFLFITNHWQKSEKVTTLHIYKYNSITVRKRLGLCFSVDMEKNFKQKARKDKGYPTPSLLCKHWACQGFGVR